MSRSCDTVVDGDTVYVSYESSVKIYSYDVTSDSWSQLPGSVRKNGSIAIINGWLTTVGGVSSNELLSLTGEGSGRRWTKKFPPMPTKRSSTAAVCTGTTLIVAGGWGEGGVLSTVEVMNTENFQWSTAADLPEPMYRASATICGGQLYMLGGTNKGYNYTKSVYTYSVSDLTQSGSFIAKLMKMYKGSTIWRLVADLPVIRSTCVSCHGQLLAIGGYDTDSRKSTTAVYMYNSTTNSWEIISHIITGRWNCVTAVLPDNRLMVVGGYTDSSSAIAIDTVEISGV